MLSAECATGCCSASLPVYNGYETFYFSQYFCPDTSSNCGSFCIMAISFGVLGLCFCICGLGFVIAFIIIIVMIVAKCRETRVEITRPNHYRSVSIVDPKLSHPDYNSVEVQQIWRKESLPPKIPGYTYTAIPAITTDVKSSSQSGAATNVPVNPTCAPSQVDS